MKKLLLVIFVLFILPTALGVENTKEAITEDIFILTAKINGSILVDEVKPILGDERANIHIQSDEFNVTFSAITEDGVVTNTNMDALSDQTIDLYMSAQTYIDIRTAEKQSQTALAAFQDGEISYETYSVLNTVKFGVVGFFLKIQGWFS